MGEGRGVWRERGVGGEDRQDKTDETDRQTDRLGGWVDGGRKGVSRVEGGYLGRVRGGSGRRMRWCWMTSKERQGKARESKAK